MITLGSNLEVIFVMYPRKKKQNQFPKLRRFMSSPARLYDTSHIVENGEHSLLCPQEMEVAQDALATTTTTTTIHD
jgi:hypothetical protein